MNVDVDRSGRVREKQEPPLRIGISGDTFKLYGIGVSRFDVSQLPDFTNVSQRWMIGLGLSKRAEGNGRKHQGAHQGAHSVPHLPSKPRAVYRQLHLACWPRGIVLHCFLLLTRTPRGIR